MAEQALTQLQAHIEAIRRESFSEGYAAAMKAVHELASRSVPQQGENAAVPNGSGSGASKTVPEPKQAALPALASDPVRGSPAKRRTGRDTASSTRGSRGDRAKRGANARMIQEILQKAAPRAVRQADIRRALEQRGVSLAYPSISHALGQLKARKAAKQVGNSGTWRYSAAA